MFEQIKEKFLKEEKKLKKDWNLMKEDDQDSVVLSSLMIVVPAFTGAGPMVALPFALAGVIAISVVVKKYHEAWR